MTDTPTESSETADTTETPEAAEAPAEEATETAEPTEAPAPAEEPSKEPDAAADLAALQERLSNLEAALAGKEEEIKALRDTAAKDAAIRDAGLPSKYAQFLHGDESAWGEQVATLLELTTKTPARPRDPAVDAQVGSDSEDRETAILRMFGLAE
nr:MAG TPA: hypothetical protein [Caudoviricetes sp.]